MNAQSRRQAIRELSGLIESDQRLVERIDMALSEHRDSGCMPSEPLAKKLAKVCEHTVSEAEALRVLGDMRQQAQARLAELDQREVPKAEKEPE